MRKSDPIIAALQADLATLGYKPGPIDGLAGPKTQAALWAFGVDHCLDPEHPNFADRVREAAAAKRAELPSVISVNGNRANLKDKARDFTKKLYLQIHQTDYWPGESCAGMKTNLYVSKERVYEVHPIESIVVGNSSDFVHIEVAWVSESRKTVKENGKTYHREAGEWTPEREALLETAILHEVEQARAKGAELTIITHCQTYRARTIDPDVEIAQAAYRIAAKHGFKLDFDWVRGSGVSAEKWYPEGCGKL
jgi:hypothetical protein